MEPIIIPFDEYVFSCVLAFFAVIFYTNFGIFIGKNFGSFSKFIQYFIDKFHEKLK